jgi:hypothetical protein
MRVDIKVETGANPVSFDLLDPVPPLPFTAVFDLWLAAWETALAAVATASQNGALSAHDAAVHRAVIAVEREIVTRQLTLLRGRARPTKVGEANRRLVRARFRPRADDPETTRS